MLFIDVLSTAFNNEKPYYYFRVDKPNKKYIGQKLIKLVATNIAASTKNTIAKVPEIKPI
jgi:hypothetical protein